MKFRNVAKVLAIFYGIYLNISAADSEQEYFRHTQSLILTRSILTIEGTYSQSPFHIKCV